MRKEVIGKANTIEEATNKAKRLLNAPDGVEIYTEVLSFPKKKLLGIFGGQVAEVRAYYGKDDAETPSTTKPQKKEPQKRQRTERTPRVRTEKKETPKRTGDAPRKDNAHTDVSPSEEIPIADLPVIDFEDKETIEYLRAILAGLGLTEIEITPKQFGDGVLFDIVFAEDYGIVIGRRGSTLDAIQYLTSLMANRGKGDYVRINVNVGDYRERRNDTLRSLAKRGASRVLRTGRNFVLDPMNPYERRVIHTAVHEIEGVVSYSVGSNNRRKVVVTLEEGARPTATDRQEQHGGRSQSSRRPDQRNRSSRPQNRPEIKPEKIVEAKVETKSELKVENVVEAKVETKSEPKVENVVETKVETKSEPKVENVVETKPVEARKAHKDVEKVALYERIDTVKTDDKE